MAGEISVHEIVIADKGEDICRNAVPDDEHAYYETINRSIVANMNAAVSLWAVPVPATILLLTPNIINQWREIEITQSNDEEVVAAMVS